MTPFCVAAGAMQLALAPIAEWVGLWDNVGDHMIVPLSVQPAITLD